MGSHSSTACDVEWVISAVQEGRVSRQLLMRGETMDQDLTLYPYIRVPNHGEICVYCCVPSPWGDVGAYINNLTEEETESIRSPTS